MSKPTLAQTNPSSRTTELAALIEQFAQDLKTNTGIEINPHSPHAWERFAAYSDAQQQIIHRNFEAFVNVVTDIRAQGIELADTTQSVWRVLKKFRWAATTDEVFSKINSDTVVEILSIDHVQLYRNTNYFKFTSYTLPDLLFYQWDELFEHNAATKEYQNYAHRIFVGQEQPAPTIEVDSYEAKEIFSANRFHVRLKPNLITPLNGIDSKRYEAILIAWDIELIGKESSAGTTLSRPLPQPTL